MVDGGSGLWFISVYGTPFPTGTADLDNSYLREAAITIAWVWGCHRNAPLHARYLAKTIARDKPVSTFECTSKHYEHRYNITNDNSCSEMFYDHNVSHKIKSLMHASRLFIYNMNMQ